MKILLGVDDSPHSRAAVGFVRRMVWPEGTRVVVVSVAPHLAPAFADLHTPPVIPVEIQEDLVRSHEDVVSTAEASLRSAGLATEAKVIRGDARVALVEEAGLLGADLVVVGSHGRTGLSKLVLGSVASHVVTHAACSVLVVKTEGR